MNFDQTKEIASIVNSASDQIVNIAVIAIAAAVAFLIKYGSVISRASRVWIALGIGTLALAAIWSYVSKGLLITLLRQIATAVTPTIALDDLSMFAFFQFASLIVGMSALATGVFISRRKLGGDVRHDGARVPRTRSQRARVPATRRSRGRRQ